MNHNKTLYALLLSLLCLSGAVSVAEETFPNRPLTMIVGFNPGGSTDIQAKALAPVLEDLLGQPVDILYLPGAGGGLAASMLASSTDQGYVFQFGTSLPYTFTPLTTPASYDVNSFRYVAALALEQSAIVTGGVKPYKTWDELLAYARENPDLTVASQTPQDRFILNLISRREGLNLRIVPTTGGAGMTPLVVSGDVHFAFSGGTHTQYTDSGQMVVLASLIDERLIGYPDVPTLREFGYEASVQNPRVVAVPANTPDTHVDALSKALEAATQDPRFIAATANVRLPVVFLDEATLTEYFNRQLEEYLWLINEYGD
ncbi:MAG: tripartite tricarboxylate transporter substrate binding protein [Natronospirillum sp.]